MAHEVKIARQSVYFDAAGFEAITSSKSICHMECMELEEVLNHIVGLSLLCQHIILRIIGHKFGKNNAGIIGCLQNYWELKWVNVMKSVKH